MIPLMMIGVLAAGSIAAGTAAAHVARRVQANRARARVRAMRAAGYIQPMPKYSSNAYITDDQIYMMGNNQTRVPMRRFGRRKMNNLRGYRAYNYWDLERFIK